MDRGQHDRAQALQWLLFVGAMLSFREAYTKVACSDQPHHTHLQEEKVYYEAYLNEDQNKLLNAMLDRAGA